MDHIKEGHALDYGPKVLPLITLLVDTKLVFTSNMTNCHNMTNFNKNFTGV